jgi:hypothetical protein
MKVELTPQPILQILPICTEELPLFSLLVYNITIELTLETTANLVQKEFKCS